MSRHAMSADDRLDIAELLARYAWAYDSGDCASYADVFAPDGVIAGPYGEDIRGRAAIIAYIERLFEERGQRGWQHLNDHIVIVGAGEECTVYSYFFIIERSADRKDFGVMTMGRYTTKCRRIDGRWLIQERSIRDWDVPGRVPWAAAEPI